MLFDPVALISRQAAASLWTRAARLGVQGASVERSTSPESVFHSPLIAVPLHRNTHIPVRVDTRRQKPARHRPRTVRDGCGAT